MIKLKRPQPFWKVMEKVEQLLRTPQKVLKLIKMLFNRVKKTMVLKALSKRTKMVI